MLIRMFGSMARRIEGGSMQKRCDYCGAPIGPHMMKCEYCDCWLWHERNDEPVAPVWMTYCSG